MITYPGSVAEYNREWADGNDVDYARCVICDAYLTADDECPDCEPTMTLVEKTDHINELACSHWGESNDWTTPLLLLCVSVTGRRCLIELQHGEADRLIERLEARC